MKPNIVGIQFRRNQSSIVQEQTSLKREIDSLVELEFMSALEEEINWNEPATFMNSYSGLILGGSGDFDFDGGRSDDDEAKWMSQVLLNKLRPLLEYVFEHDIPTLGICYGHQLLGAFAGARVVCDTVQRKTASHQVNKVVSNEEVSTLFDDLPDTFWAHYAHKDVLDRIPQGATLLMQGGGQCQVSALRYRNNIYSTQFHPELSYADLMQRMKAAPHYLPEGMTAEEAFMDDTSSSQLLRNFAKHVTKRSVHNYK